MFAPIHWLHATVLQMPATRRAAYALLELAPTSQKKSFCNSPPDACHVASGTCNAGVCSYESIVCSTPPDVCHAASGSCSAGQCPYDGLTGADCPGGTCQAGNCVATPEPEAPEAGVLDAGGDADSHREASAPAVDAADDGAAPDAIDSADSISENEVPEASEADAGAEWVDARALDDAPTAADAHVAADSTTPVKDAAAEVANADAHGDEGSGQIEVSSAGCSCRVGAPPVRGSTLLLYSGLPADLDGVLDPTESLAPLGYTIDIPGREFIAFDPRSEALQVNRPPLEGAVVAWLREAHGRRPFVMLDNGDRALIDTGSSLGLAIRDPNAASRSDAAGARDVGGGRIATRRVSTSTIAIGSLTLKDPNRPCFGG